MADGPVFTSSAMRQRTEVAADVVKQTTDKQSGDGQDAVAYTHIAFRYRLPFRLFLDDSQYDVLVNAMNWQVRTSTSQHSSLDFTTPMLAFNVKTQLFLDSHGYTGATEVLVATSFERALTKA